MINLKHVIAVFLFLFTAATFASSDSEQKTEEWLDSAFSAENIDWEQTKKEFLLFSKANFKKSVSIADFLIALKESASPKREKELDLITTGFKKLESFSTSVAELLEPLENCILSIILQEDRWCNMDDYKALYLSIRHINYYAPQNFGTYALTDRLISLDYKIESVSLHEKLAVMIILQKIFSTNAESIEDIASEKRTKFSQCDINSTYDPGTDSTFETTADETEPCFLGGYEAMVLYIRDMVQYPQFSKEMGEQGTVYVQFVVNADGSISDICVLKSPADLLSKEAVRVISSMPRWEPGFQQGKAVRVRYNIPINFRLT